MRRAMSMVALINPFGYKRPIRYDRSYCSYWTITTCNGGEQRAGGPTLSDSAFHVHLTLHDTKGSLLQGSE